MQIIFPRLKRVIPIVLLAVLVAHAQPVPVNWKDKEVVEALASIQKVKMNGYIPAEDGRLYPFSPELEAGVEPVKKVGSLEVIPPGEEADALLSLIPADIYTPPPDLYIVTVRGIGQSATVTVSPVYPATGGGWVVVLTSTKLSKVLYAGYERTPEKAYKKIDSFIAKATKRLAKQSK